MEKNTQTKTFHNDLLKNSNIIKLILMLLVVLGHSIAFWNGEWFNVIPCYRISPFLSLVDKVIASVHIYGFILVSGYLYSYNRDECQKYQIFIEFILIKAKRLLVPAIFASVIWIFPIQNYFYHYSFQEFFEKFILFKEGGQVWFLVMLFFIFIIRWLWDRLSLRGLVWEMVLMVFACIIGLIWGRCFDNIFRINDAFSYYLYFEIGILLRKGQKGEFGEQLKKFLNLRILGFLCVVLWYILLSFTQVRKIDGFLLETLIHVFGSIGIVLTLNLACKGGQGVKVLEDNAIGILMFHQQIIMILIYLLNTKINIYILAALNFFVSFSIATCISIALGKYKATRFLVGKK